MIPPLPDAGVAALYRISKGRARASADRERRQKVSREAMAKSAEVQSMTAHSTHFLLCACAVVMAAGLSGAWSGEQRAGRAAISPILVRLLPGATQQFSIHIDGNSTRRTSWFVNDVKGGNSQIGTISRDGLYRAPAQPPTPCEIHIHAVIAGAENQHLWSTVLVGLDVPSYRLLARWGAHGEGQGQFLEPHGIALDKDGNLLIADPVRSRVFRFTPEGKFLRELGLGPGSAPGAFQGPPDVEVNADGNIFVLDRGNNRIQEFTHAGEFIRSWGEAGRGPGRFLRPHSIAFDRQGRIYIADTDNGLIQVFDRSGKFLFSWATGDPGSDRFNAPHGAAVDANSDVFVADYYGGCRKFTGDGKPLFSFAPLDEKCHALASDRWGDVYLMSRHPAFGASILKYNNNGALVARWALASAEVKAFHPKCAAVDNKGRIYVTEADGANVAVDVLEPE